MLFEHGDRVVFTGDSITWWYRENPQDLGIGYTRILDYILNVTYPEMYLTFVNTGENGMDSKGLSLSVDDMILKHDPTWVSIMIGANDVWRIFDSPAIKPTHGDREKYRENLHSILDQVLPKVKGVVMVSPYYLETNREDAMRKEIDAYIAIFKEVAEEYAKDHNVIYVDTQKAFDDYMQYRHPTYINWDRVHPGPIGSTILAREFLKAIGFDREF